VTASKAKALPEDQKTLIEAAAPAEKKKTAKASKAADAAAPAKVAAKRGPKAKAVKAGKKGEDHDIDMSDIEEDLVGEPEVTEVAEASTEKVKPLRMKISKAKERA
jgi:RNA polymerase primary sigma factor